MPRKTAAAQNPTRVLLDEMADQMAATMRAYRQSGTKEWDARMALRDLAYQAGGLQKLDMQLNNERHKAGKTTAQLRQAMETELAEVMALALFIAREMDMDILDGFSRMRDSDRRKIAARKAGFTLLPKPPDQTTKTRKARVPRGRS